MYTKKWGPRRSGDRSKWFLNFQQLTVNLCYAALNVAQSPERFCFTVFDIRLSVLRCVVQHEEKLVRNSVAEVMGWVYNLKMANPLSKIRIKQQHLWWSNGHDFCLSINCQLRRRSGFDSPSESILLSSRPWVLLRSTHLFFIFFFLFGDMILKALGAKQRK